ncbi:hypothetical protein MKW94_019615 [Papaver nudicaule]|uniref:Transposase-associated domain-containing protein n=1 Tax=Papaver nudicaule TaxID=74823 RepID=A0AA41V5Y1_PAPNU|nr:hypothetical protein [Papaver nudicaule]
MDKFWMRMGRLIPEYIAGVNHFLNFAIQDAERRKLRRIFCPCVVCVNKRRKTVEDVIAKLEGPVVSQYCALRLLQRSSIWNWLHLMNLYMNLKESWYGVASFWLHMYCT